MTPVTEMKRVILGILIVSHMNSTPIISDLFLALTVLDS